MLRASFQRERPSSGLKYRDAECSQLWWTPFGAGGDQAWGGLACLLGPRHVVLGTVAFPHLTVLA